MPYHWQYNFAIGYDKWNSFSEKDNLTLEKLYCNVETKAVTFKPAQSLDTGHERQVHAIVI